MPNGDKWYQNPVTPVKKTTVPGVTPAWAANFPNPLQQNPLQQNNPLINAWGGNGYKPYGPAPVVPPPAWAANFPNPLQQNPLQQKNLLINPWGGSGQKAYGPPMMVSPAQAEVAPAATPDYNTPVGFGSQYFENTGNGAAPYTYFQNAPGGYPAYSQPAAVKGAAKAAPKTWWSGKGGGGGGYGTAGNAYDSWVNAMARWNID